MKIAPLIHSRTGVCDYNSKFAVSPTNFSSDSISWARSKILAATLNIDRLNGIRRLVAVKDGICIAGVVCTMKYFVNNCLTDSDKNDAQPYVDVQGRLYGVFLGYVFKPSGNEIPDVTDADLWQWFKNFLVPEWNKKSARTVEVDYFDWNKTVSDRTVENSPTDKYFDAQLYDAATFDDEELFREYLSKAVTSTNEIAFCSNVDKIQPVEEGIYTAVTTSASNIAALKNRAQEQSPRIVPQKKTNGSVPPNQTAVSTSSTSTKPTNARNQPQSTPTSRTFQSKWLWIGLIGLAVLVVVILLLLMR